MSRVNLPVLTQADIALLREVVARERNRTQNTPGRPNLQERPPQAPEVYVVKTPATGILGVSGLFADVPQWAECDVYRLTDGALISIDKTLNVYNLCTTRVPAGSFGLASRDKFGTWYLTSLLCDPTPNAFTGTGSAADPGFCPCDDPAQSMCVTIPGITAPVIGGDDCSAYCELFAGGVTLPRAGGCIWQVSYHSPSDPSRGACGYYYFDAVFQWYNGKWIFFISVQVAGVDVAYEADDWDCVSPLVMTKTFQNTNTTEIFAHALCKNYPNTITVIPGVCEAGTGTGVIVGAVWVDTFTTASDAALGFHTPDLSPGGVGYSVSAGTTVVQASTNTVKFDPGFNSFFFDPGVIGTLNVSVDVRFTASADGDNFSVTWAAPNSLQVNVARVSGTTWNISVSDSGGSDSHNVTLSDGASHTLTIVASPSSVSATINSVTAHITPAAGSLSNSPIRVDSTGVGAYLEMDNLIVTT